MKYAVSAATGNFGQTAVKALVDEVGADKVVAIVRHEEKGKKLLPAGIEIRQADYGDEAAVEKALAGVDKLLFISSQPGGAVARSDQHRNVVEAVKKAGVGYVAYTSFPKASESDNWLAADHKLTEGLIKDSGVKHSFLRNNWYLENEMTFLAPGPANRTYWANNFAGWALESEYARAAVKVLVSDDPKEVYEFAGPKRSYEDLGKALNQASGQDEAAKQVSQDEYVKLLESLGLNHDLAAMYAGFQQPIDDGSLTEDSSDLEEVLGGLTPLDQAIKELLNK
ncbi:NAD(P)-dependent oxidoreductase [Lactobacillus nasalidis]|uniref:NAD(P)-dependent oxidoreductase n=1 Tax=Lactobacillus nasalidis TaxID=2797258 RepID=A0ABQ3W6M7_9LACO|nr:NAD(P)H-binding protein [Lactobacillus nasalidis]GHV97674.1 NAD(P)-dependent oxidoreductase [Lactobacillus nasalidis]GHV98915.1 NAD(P)-dependent oxidoreductase [Lactobacillus nasalidis]GHW00990.1 NAD(P)-dependent oxidoreductase [Lactobacillus nasalidis]